LKPPPIECFEEDLSIAGSVSSALPSKLANYPVLLLGELVPISVDPTLFNIYPMLILPEGELELFSLPIA
jgi:hypothetical protein